MQLYEKHRPKTLDQVLGQNKAIQTIRILIERGIGGRALWVSGPSGTGKTTLARIVAASIAGDLYIQEFDSADQLSVSAIDKIESDMQYRGFGKGGKAYIINESHGLRKPVVRRLLGLLENLSDFIVFIFTTTKQGETKLFEDSIDASPLLSRCVKIELTSQGLSRVFAEHCRDIANKENLNGKPIESYVKLAQKCKNNCRMMFQEIESGTMI